MATALVPCGWRYAVGKAAAGRRLTPGATL